MASSSSRRHPMYHGIRCRGGKWVSEIREPRKTSRIWLGTFPTPEMAAAAYDVASLALKGSDAVLNFPGLVERYPKPLSTSPADVRSAATAAAALMGADDQSSHNVNNEPVGINDRPGNTYDTTISSSYGTEFLDEEAIFDMPGLLVDMAEGMLLSPPRLMTPPRSDNSPQKSYEETNLWSYF
ncbi:hypothetical protein L6164_019520 [Bauhinia variegata]|uniref:Uncharacterized protein n=1 Tax=Bauhinia variegata TaxID=167791 RepID=A0ACB9MSV7_BAUVA|nr:hypothetical protein L6164_019520 [Bauhinia variegata]